MNAARRMPLGGGVVIDRRRMIELIEELRLAIPANIRQARGIIERGEHAIFEAEQTGARIVADARREAEQTVADTEIMREARERAHQTEMHAGDEASRVVAAARADAERRLDEAAERVKSQEREADRYALAVINGLEERLDAYLRNLREVKAQFSEAGAGTDVGDEDEDETEPAR